MRTRLRVPGMSCQHCVNAVFTALTPVEGIITAHVEIGTVVVEHDGRATADALRDAIAVAGYDVVLAGEERRQLPIV
ncbi:MAG TPA: heavy-metal-associated domain-containing protein [Gemmatimonadaceae bacterium]|nr:heavy-metal-associated domain-containing protein [Gemmatimonadaceae bacterium]